MPRKYSSTSTDTTLTAVLTAGGTTCTVASAANLLGGVTIGAGDSFTIVFAPDTSSEEIALITAVSSNTITVTRALGGTSAQQHEIGTTVRHVLTSVELTDFETVRSNYITAASTTTVTNKTMNLSSNTLTGTTAQFNTALSDNDFATLAGTETLTNKTLTSPTANDPKLNLTLNAQTGTTYTLALTDNGKLVTASNTSAIAVSIPTNASVAFPTGAQVHIAQIGAGQVTISAATTATTTVTSTGATTAAPALRAQYSSATCIKTGTDTWLVVGDIE